MNIDTASFESQSRITVQQFLSHALNANDFCSSFTNIWMKFRDEQERIRLTWPEPYDRQLVEARIRNELSPEEFAQRYGDLWHLKATERLSEMINTIHSTCSVFSPSPKLDWEIDERQLRDEVEQIMRRYDERK